MCREKFGDPKTIYRYQKNQNQTYKHTTQAPAAMFHVMDTEKDKHAQSIRITPTCVFSTAALSSFLSAAASSARAFTSPDWLASFSCSWLSRDAASRFCSSMFDRSLREGREKERENTPRHGWDTCSIETLFVCCCVEIFFKGCLSVQYCCCCGSLFIYDVLRKRKGGDEALSSYDRLMF